MKRLNFGCGSNIREGWDNVDMQKSPRLSKSFEFNEFPYPIEDNTYDYVFSRNVLEHLDELKKVMNELWRVSKKGAMIEIIVPYYNNKGAYSALDHKHFLNDTAFEELIKQTTTLNKKQVFRKIEIKLVPTLPGKFLLRFFREKLSLFIGGLISEINVKLEVIKDEKRKAR